MSPLVVAFYVYVSLYLLSTYVTLVLVQLHVMFHAVVVHSSLDINCVRTELAFVDVCVLEMIVGLNIWSRLVWREEREFLGDVEVSQELLLLAGALLLQLLLLPLHQLAVRLLVLLELRREPEDVVAELASVEVDVEVVIEVPLDEVRLVLLNAAVAKGALIHATAGIVDGVAKDHLVRLLLGEQFPLGQLCQDRAIVPEKWMWSRPNKHLL